MMASGTAIWGTVAPKIQILDLPFLFRDYDHIHKTMDGDVGLALSKYLEERTGADHSPTTIPLVSGAS